MEPHDEIIEALERIEANQVKAQQAQAEHIALAKAQLERSERTINESVALQKVSDNRSCQPIHAIVQSCEPFFYSSRR